MFSMPWRSECRSAETAGPRWPAKRCGKTHFLCIPLEIHPDKSYSQTTLTHSGLKASACPHSTILKRTPSWFAATSLDPLCQMRMFPLGSPNETHLPRYMDDKRRLRGVRRHDVRTSLVSAQGMKTPFEVYAVTAVSTKTRLHPGLLTN